MWSLSWASGGRRLSFLVCLNLLWPCSLIETSDRVKWDSPITKWSFILSLGLATEAERSCLSWHDQKLSMLGASLCENDIRSSIRSLGVRSRCRRWCAIWWCCRSKISISSNESLIGCVPSMRLLYSKHPGWMKHDDTSEWSLGFMYHHSCWYTIYYLFSTLHNTLSTSSPLGAYLIA